MSKDLSSLVEPSIEEILHDKKREMRSGFSAQGDKPLCLVPHREFAQLLNKLFNVGGCDYYNKSQKPSFEYFGFILVSAEIDKIMFAVEI
jgi:hypothetical protein